MMMMMITTTTHKRKKTPASNKKKPKVWSRWYEKDKQLLDFVNVLRHMPTPIMEVYSKCISAYALDLYKNRNHRLYFIESGSAKHQALLKSMTKKRWCDKNPYSYKAFNALFLMDELLRQELVTRLNASTELLNVYQYHCQKMEITPNLAIFEQILLTFLQENEEAALAQLQLLNTPLLTSTLFENTFI